MIIGVIQASSQKSKNSLLYDCVCKTAGHNEVVNFGCFEDEQENYSYIDIACEVGLLLASGAVDFMVTGCSSGQGMMLACNMFSGVLCGYSPTPQDAFLFGRINGGNAASVPLGLNFGWCGEINLTHTLSALFDGDFGSGYPPRDSARKQKDTERLKLIGSLSKRSIVEVLESFDENDIRRILSRKNVTDYIIAHGTKPEIVSWIKSHI